MSNELCDGACNSCPVINHRNSRLLSAVLNEAHDRFGNEFNRIVQRACPNMTVCFDCRIDDFCHSEDCEILKHNQQEQGKKPS
jgi:hypothetical protein